MCFWRYEWSIIQCSSITGPSEGAHISGVFGSNVLLVGMKLAFECVQVLRRKSEFLRVDVVVHVLLRMKCCRCRFMFNALFETTTFLLKQDVVCEWFELEDLY